MNSAKYERITHVSAIRMNDNTIDSHINLLYRSEKSQKQALFLQKACPRLQIILNNFKSCTRHFLTNFMTYLKYFLFFGD